MPARSSSPIPAGLGQVAAARPVESEEHPHLLHCLAAVPDPRRAKGRRHPLAFVLALAATLYSEPAGGVYHRQWSGKFGDSVPVPEPFAFDLASSDLIRYPA